MSLQDFALFDKFVIIKIEDMKYILIMLVAMLCSTITANAQEAAKKRIVIIKKTKDEKGKVTTEEIEASGAEVDKLIEELKKDGTLDGIDIDIDEIKKSGSTTVQKRIEIKEEVSEDMVVEKKIVDGQETTSYTITSSDPGGKKVMVWNGDGEIPEEIAKKVKDQNMKQIDLTDGKEMIFIANDDDVEFELEVINNNKVQLGVLVDDSKGVFVDDVIADSPAHKAGLQKGDTILKVADQYTFNLNMLIESLSGFDKGQKTKVTYIRDGKEKTIKVRF